MKCLLKEALQTKTGINLKIEKYKFGVGKFRKRAVHMTLILTHFPLASWKNKTYQSMEVYLAL